MSDDPETNVERPCLHCLICDLIDGFYEEYGSPSGEPNTSDPGEMLSALAKTVAEMTYDSEAGQRQRIVDEFMQELSRFEVELRESAQAETPISHARH